jgi:hypothetical protein
MSRKTLPDPRYSALTAIPKMPRTPSATSSSPQLHPSPPLTQPRIELLLNQAPAQTHSNDIAASIAGGFLQVAVSAAPTQRSPRPRSSCGRSRYSPKTSRSNLPEPRPSLVSNNRATVNVSHPNGPVQQGRLISVSQTHPAIFNLASTCELRWRNRG